MSVDMSSKIDELAHNMGEVINRANTLMDKFEKNESDIAGIEENLKNKANLLTENLEWTVGSGGNYSKLSEALIAASKYNPLNYTIEITLKRGYKLSEALIINSANLGFVIIKAEDTEVLVDDSGLVDTNYIFSFYNSFSPAIDFSAKYIGSKKINFVLSDKSLVFIKPTRGCSGFNRSIVSGLGGYIVANRTYVENCKQWGYYANGGDLDCVEAELKNISASTMEFLIYSGYNGRTIASNIKFTNISNGYIQNTGSKILLGKPTFSNVKYSTRAFFGVYGGGTLQYQGPTSISGIDTLANIPFNQPSSNGHIYQTA
ncbi:hypothetical protein AB5E60_000872 [Campylobacter coli]|nr:hypothetical protein [Campylobacter lari]